MTATYLFLHGFSLVFFSGSPNAFYIRLFISAYVISIEHVLDVVTELNKNTRIKEAVSGVDCIIIMSMLCELILKSVISSSHFSQRKHQINTYLYLISTHLERVFEVSVNWIR